MTLHQQFPMVTGELAAFGPIASDPLQVSLLAQQHLALEVANKTTELAMLRAKCNVVTAYLDALQIEHWNRQVLVNDGDGIEYGVLVIPPEDQDALSRLLSALEQLR